MNIAENKYHSTIKVEFKDLVRNIANSERTHFHTYTIHRLLSLGLLIDFPFQYVKNSCCDCKIEVELDLKAYGKVTFRIDPDTNYGYIANESSKEILKDFSETFSTNIENPESTKRKWFRK